MKNARVIIDGTKVSMASLIAMAGKLDSKRSKPKKFTIPIHSDLIRVGMSDLYPNTIMQRIEIAKKSKSGFIGMWYRDIGLYLPKHF